MAKEKKKQHYVPQAYLESWSVVELSDLDSVKDYNSRCILHSDTCVFSKTDDFSLIEEMLSKNPDILDMPHTVVRWGGKTYSPRRE